jgi:hypothetical protein
VSGSPWRADGRSLLRSTEPAVSVEPWQLGGTLGWCGGWHERICRRDGHGQARNSAPDHFRDPQRNVTSHPTLDTFPIAFVSVRELVGGLASQKQLSPLSRKPGRRRGVTREIAERLLPTRWLRTFPRVVKRKISSFGVKRARHRAWPQPMLPPAEAVVIVGPSKPAPIRRLRRSTTRRRAPTGSAGATSTQPAEST